MTSTQVPPVDLAPGMPSRVVTISATDVTEGGQSQAGQKVVFALSDTLDVSSGGDVIAKTQATVTLDADGNGSIRLPVYDEDVRTWCGREWAILVSGLGSQKAIRVPAGTSSIALSALPPVRPLRGRELQWAVTGASVSVTEGAVWDVDVSLSGGVLDFDFTVPPGATAFWKGTLPRTADLDTVTTPGMYGVWSNTPGAPGSGVMIVSEIRTEAGVLSQVQQTFLVSGDTVWTRFQGSVWSDWRWIAGRDGMRLQQFGAVNDLDDATAPGIYAYWAGTANAPGGSGFAIVSEIRTEAGVLAQVQQIAFTTGSNPAMHMRFKGSVWAGWTRTDAGAVEIPPPAGGGESSALKRVPLILTAATGSGEDSTASGSIRFPLHYGARITRWRVHVRNYNYAAGTSFASGGTISGMWFGKGWDGAFASAPTQVGWPLTIPTDGSEVVTPWISTPIEADEQHMLSVGWTAPTSSPKVLTPGGGWRSTSSAAAPGQSGSGFSVSNWIPFDWWIEAETAPTTPTVAGYGDSITAGTGTSLLVNDSWLAQYARSIGALPVHYAYPGSGMVLWMDPADPKWTRWADFPLADAVIHFMGQNDLGTAETAAEMQERFETTMPMIKAHISPNVAVATITPHAGKTAAQNAVRREHAAYLRTLPLGVRDLFDFAAAVSDDDTALRPEYRGGGGTDELHPNTAGAAAMAATITRPIVAVVAAPDWSAMIAALNAAAA